VRVIISPRKYVERVAATCATLSFLRNLFRKGKIINEELGIDLNGM
jgi:hypothetical protein